MLERQVTIKNDKLKKLLLEKEELQGAKNELLKEHDQFREKFLEEIKINKEALGENKDKVIELAKDIVVDLQDYDEIKSIVVVKDEVTLNIVDKVEEFKKQFKEIKENIDTLTPETRVDE